MKNYKTWEEDRFFEDVPEKKPQKKYSPKKEIFKIKNSIIEMLKEKKIKSYSQIRPYIHKKIDSLCSLGDETANFQMRVEENNIWIENNKKKRFDLSVLLPEKSVFVIQKTEKLSANQSLKDEEKKYIVLPLSKTKHPIFLMEVLHEIGHLHDQSIKDFYEKNIPEILEKIITSNIPSLKKEEIREISINFKKILNSKEEFRRKEIEEMAEKIKKNKDVLWKIFRQYEDLSRFKFEPHRAELPKKIVETFENEEYRSEKYAWEYTFKTLKRLESLGFCINIPEEVLQSYAGLFLLTYEISYIPNWEKKKEIENFL